jgi:hypothetical protein
MVEDPSPGPSGASAHGSRVATVSTSAEPVGPTGTGGRERQDERAERGQNLRPRRSVLVRAAATSIPVLVVIVVLASALSGGGPSVPASRAQAPANAPRSDRALAIPSLPEGLGFITSGLDGGPAGGLRLVVRGRAPLTPRAGRRATSFAWSSDGSHIAVVDPAGALRLLPEGTRIDGPVRSFAFSHDGTRIAVCSGVRAHAPHLSVRYAREGLDPLFAPVPGCDPAWSADDAYVSYRVAGPSSRSPVERFAMNAHLGVRFRLPGTGPVAWAPASGYVFAPVTTVSADCRRVLMMDPRGGRRRVIAVLPDLPVAGARAARPARPACAVAMLAWSSDARWLAVAIAPGNGWPQLLFLFEPRTHALVDVPLAPVGLMPTSLTWSPDGRNLLVVGRGPDGPLSLEAAPDGGRVVQRVAADDASWSADGAWILGHDAGGWAAFEGSNLAHRVAIAIIPAGAPTAAWCCPPVEVVSTAPPAR